MKNGDQKYLVDFTEGRNLGNYHLIDGVSAHVSYLGQSGTCGRCHSTTSHCPGRTIARKCEENSGPKVQLKDHMMSLWKEINYKPSEFTQHRDDDDDILDDVAQKAGSAFTPQYKKEQSAEQSNDLTGVSVRGFPNDAIDSDLILLLENSDMPKYHKDLMINRNPFSMTVDVENLSHEECLELLKNVDGTTKLSA